MAREEHRGKGDEPEHRTPMTLGDGAGTELSGARDEDILKQPAVRVRSSPRVPARERGARVESARIG
jgi:hypothetical protein